MRIKKTSQYIEGGAGLPSYFTDEIDTGMKWTDGKPIYRKVIQGTKVSGSTLVITINSCDTIINVYGYIKVNDNGTYYEYPLNYYESSSSFVRTNWMNGQIVIRSSTGTFINGEAIVIAEYTKTTD